MLRSIDYSVVHVKEGDVYMIRYAPECFIPTSRFSTGSNRDKSLVAARDSKLKVTIRYAPANITLLRVRGRCRALVAEGLYEHVVSSHRR